MSTWVVIPAKSPAQAKSRLAAAMAASERADLARRLLARTVRTALAVPAVSGIVVVSASAELRALAISMGALACADPGDHAGDPLNAAIVEGCKRAAERGATMALVLPADLPLLQPHVITAFLDEAGDAPVALAPDSAGTGTNALLLRLPLLMPPAFGADSFHRHRAAARARNLGVAAIRLPELARDLDTPADLTRLATDLTTGPAHGA
jgi:2-phospho-L-lactate guanylyltransferase